MSLCRELSSCAGTQVNPSADRGFLPQKEAMTHTWHGAVHHRSQPSQALVTPQTRSNLSRISHPLCRESTVGGLKAHCFRWDLDSLFQYNEKQTPNTRSIANSKQKDTKSVSLWYLLSLSFNSFSLGVQQWAEFKSNKMCPLSSLEWQARGSKMWHLQFLVGSVGGSPFFLSHPLLVHRGTSLRHKFGLKDVCFLHSRIWHDLYWCWQEY